MEDTPKCVIEILDEISSDTLKDVLHKTASLKDGSRVELLIGSYGGEILCAIGIADALKRLDTHANVIGFACSAAAIIAIACKEVSMSEHASLMIHSAWSDASDSDDPGIKRCNELQLKIINERCPSYTAEMLMSDTWINAEQAMQLHLCDNIYIDDGNDYAAMCRKYAAKLDKLFNSTRNEPQRRLIMAEEVNVNEVLEEVKEDEEKKEEEVNAEEPIEEQHDVIEVIEKLVERVNELEGRLKALEEPVKDEDPEAECEPEDDDKRINNLYNALCQPKAAVSVVCASAKSSAPVVQKVKAGFEKYTRI